LDLCFSQMLGTKFQQKKAARSTIGDLLSNIIFTFQNNDPNTRNEEACRKQTYTVYSFSMSVVQYMGLNVTKSCTWDTLSNSIGNLRHIYINCIILYQTMPLNPCFTGDFVVPPKRSHQTPKGSAVDRWSILRSPSDVTAPPSSERSIAAWPVGRWPKKNMFRHEWIKSFNDGAPFEVYVYNVYIYIYK